MGRIIFVSHYNKNYSIINNRKLRVHHSKIATEYINFISKIKIEPIKIKCTKVKVEIVLDADSVNPKRVNIKILIKRKQNNRIDLMNE